MAKLETELRKVNLDELPAKMFKKLLKDQRHFHLRDARVGLLWHWPDLKSKGREVLGKACKPAKLLAFYSKCDFVILISTNTWKLLSDEQKAAVIDHEMRHCGVKKKDGEMLMKGGKFVYELVPHDIEIFVEDITRSGMDCPGVPMIYDACKQLTLNLDGEVEIIGNDDNQCEKDMCSQCSGTGWYKKKDCQECNGTGHLNGKKDSVDGKQKTAV